jgi:hypothetical protein
MDPLLFHTPNGGEMEITGGVTALTAGYANAAYLSMFGGNEQDSGDDDTKTKQWWANLTESAPERQYRSRTQYLLKSLPAVPANLRAIEDAIEGDLAWFVDLGIATLVAGTARLVGVNRVSIEARITIEDEVQTFKLERPWGQA